METSTRANSAVQNNKSTKDASIRPASEDARTDSTRTTPRRPRDRRSTQANDHGHSQIPRMD